MKDLTLARKSFKKFGNDDEVGYEGFDSGKKVSQEVWK
jgi:hypothetical protein